jgi:hypothetical protein
MMPPIFAPYQIFPPTNATKRSADVKRQTEQQTNHASSRNRAGLRLFGVGLRDLE